jgi:hypothetical protein
MIKEQTYTLRNVEINVYYNYDAGQQGNYFDRPISPSVEILKIWLPTDESKTDLMPIIPAYEIDFMEDYFLEYEIDLSYE